MCEFSGVIGLKPKQQLITAVLESIQSSGPDDTGFVQGPWFALGFFSFSIVDSNEVYQPVSNTSGEVHLVFNGEIYNLRSMRKKVSEGYPLRDNSEAGILLSCYEMYGPSFINYLDGVFAIAVVDNRSKACYLFRDPFGVKPLYYSLIDGGSTWVFTSNLRAFFNYPGFSTDLDWVALAERKVLEFWSADRTCFEKIHQLLPGCFIKLQLAIKSEDKRIQAKSVAYFNPKNGRCQKVEEVSAQDIIKKSSELIRASVIKRVQHARAYPVVLALSGGIDSTLIAAFLSQIEFEHAATLTISDRQDYEDPRYAAKVARELRLFHHSYRIELIDFLNELPRMILTPGGAGPNFSSYFLGRAVRELEPSAKVILCGTGADEFFLGYPLYTYYEAYFSKIFNTLRNTSCKWIENSPILQRVSKWTKMSPEKMRLDLLSMFQYDQLASDLLLLNHGPMAFGLECRHPFLDRELVDYIQAFPPYLKILGETPKILLRLVLADVFSDKPELKQSLLKRRPCPVFFATSGCVRWLTGFLEEKIPKSKLTYSSIAASAKDSLDLFWLGSVFVIFLVHRGNISGMTFEDLADQVFNLSTE